MGKLISPDIWQKRKSKTFLFSVNGHDKPYKLSCYYDSLVEPPLAHFTTWGSLASAEETKKLMAGINKKK